MIRWNLRFWLLRFRWRLAQLTCVIREHDAPYGECYRCGMIVDGEA